MPSKPKSSNIQNDSLAWILYRKQPWPVMVKRVYPKKLTYNFLPVSSHPTVFNTTLKNIRPFLLGDQLPSGATKEQQEAYNIAMAIVTKASNTIDRTSSSAEDADEVVKDADEVVEDADEVVESKPAVEHASAKTRGTASAFKAKPAAAAKKPAEEVENGSSESSDDGDTADEAFVDYAPGDVAIVDTTRGAWPVRVTEIADENSTIIYELFPPPSAAQGRVSTDKVTRFPADEIDTLIADSKRQPNLCKAFKNVKTYLGLGGGVVETATKPDEETEEEEKDEEEEEPPRLKRGKNIAKPLTKASSNKPAVVPKTAANGDGKSATSSGPSKKKATEKPVKKEEKMEVESRRQTRKRRLDVEEPVEKEPEESEKATNEDEAELSPDSSVDHVVKKRNGRGEPAPASSTATAAKEKRRANATDDVRPDSTISVVQQAKGKFTSALKETSPVAPAVTRRRLGMNRGMAASSPKREEPKEPVIERKVEVVAPAKSKTPDFLQTLISDDAAAHMSAIWTGERKTMRVESSSYAPPMTVDGMDVRFQPFGRFFTTADELHESVAEIRKWTQLCTKLPKMALLTELHYIANVVLPEACIFALSKTKNCSLSDAADKFERMCSEKSLNNKEKVDVEPIKSKTALRNGNDSTSGNGSTSSRNGSATSVASSNGKPTNGGLHELVLAASMMAKTAGDGAATLTGNKALNFNSSCEGAMYIVEEDSEEN